MCTCHPPQTQDIHEKLRKEAPALAQTNGGCLPHKVLSTMADNCPTAKATARHFEKVVRASRENYFSDQQIAALPEEMKHVIAGNCDNHSRSSIATEFFRLSGPALEDVLGEAAEQFSAVERLELRRRWRVAGTAAKASIIRQRRGQSRGQPRRGGAAQAQTPRRSKRQRQL